MLLRQVGIFILALSLSLVFVSRARAFSLPPGTTPPPPDCSDVYSCPPPPTCEIVWVCGWQETSDGQQDYFCDPVEICNYP